MDISADGRQCVVATYAHGTLFQRQTSESWQSALARRGEALVLPLRRQGETICFGAERPELWLTSEKVPAPLWKVPLPGRPAP
jgi:hypothetical protein